MEGLDEGKSIDGDRKLAFYFGVCSFYAMKSLTLVYRFCGVEKDDIVIEEERKSIWWGVWMKVGITVDGKRYDGNIFILCDEIFNFIKSFLLSRKNDIVIEGGESIWLGVWMKVGINIEGRRCDVMV